MDVNAVFNNTIFDSMWNDFPVSNEKERKQLAKLRSIITNFQGNTFLSKILQIKTISSDPLISGIKPAALISSITTVADPASEMELCNNIAVRFNNEMQAVQNGQALYDFVEVYHEAHIENYQTIYKSICLQLAKYQMGGSISIIETIFQNATNHVLSNVSTVLPGILDSEVDQMMDLEDYLTRVSTTVYNHFAQTKPLQIAPMTRGYLVSHLPFLIFNYILSFIKTGADASNKPDTFIVHQFALLVTKVFIIQSLLVVYNGADEQRKALLKPRIMSFLNSIMLEYKNQNFTSYYTKINTLIHDNTVYQEDIRLINDKISKSKMNLEKASVNVLGIRGAVKMSYVNMYIWMSMLIVLVVAVATLVFLLKKKPENAELWMNILYGVCGVLVLGVSINLFVTTMRTT